METATGYIRRGWLYAYQDGASLNFLMRDSEIDPNASIGAPPPDLMKAILTEALEGKWAVVERWPDTSLLGFGEVTITIRLERGRDT